MRAINATIMRHMNRTLILNQIRLRPISRAELAEETGLTRASVTQIVEELISEGLVIETSIIGRTRLGRRSTQLAINPRSGAFFGIYLERDQCTVGAIDMHGKVLRQNTELVAGRTPDEVIDSIAATIHLQIGQLNLDRARVRGVGVCAPGPVDCAEGVLLNPAGLPAWRGLPVAGMLSARTGMTVFPESAANAQALEEKYFGNAGDTFLLVRAAETVSIGAVVDGALCRGRRAFPVDLGSCPTDMAGGPALDNLISIPALLERTACRTADELLACCDAGEIPGALAEPLAMCIAGVMHSFCIDSVVLAGPLGQSAALRDRLNADIRRACRYPLESGPIRPGVASNPIRLAAAPAYASLFQT